MADGEDGGLLVGAADAARLAMLSHKQVFGEVMGRIAERDADLTVVVSDYGRRLNLERMRELRPDGFVQCGIAEQNQVEVAAALANEGFCVFAPSYATFITSRVLDQLRVNLGIMSSPVILVGVSCGCDSGTLGASHMALEDIGCTRQLPGVTVVCPSDNAEFAAVLMELAERPRPAYVRMNDIGGVNLHPHGVGRVIGRAQSLRPSRPAVAEGERGEAPCVCVVACGTLCAQALAAADLLAARGISCELIEMATIKPLDMAALDGVASCGLVVSVEEHSVIGGLGSAIAEHLCDRGVGVPLLRLGMPDRYLEADERDALLARAGLDALGIAKAIADRVEAKGLAQAAPDGRLSPRPCEDLASSYGDTE